MPATRESARPPHLAEDQLATERPLTCRRLIVVVVTALVVVGVGSVGFVLVENGVVLHLLGGVLIRGPFDLGYEPPLLAAVAVAGLVIWRGPPLSRQLGWSGLLTGVWGVSAGWSVALAVGRRNAVGADGITGPLESRYEYLNDIHRVTDLGSLLRGYIASVPGSSAHPWTTHVAGHPPGPLAFFVLLDRLGLGGSGWAATACIIVGSSSAAAVLVAVRALHGESSARTLASFLVLAPYSLWIATSADDLWLGTSAWGIALLCVALARERGRAPLFVGSGLLLGLALFGSYGVAVLGVVVVVVLFVGGVRLEIGWMGLGVAIPVLAAGLAGFWWWEGLAATTRRVVEGPAAIDRPFGYFVLANLAVAAIAVGPAVVAALPDRRLWSLPLAWSALLAIVLADVTALSKGEVERIWLPFYPWITVAVLLLPRSQDRRWLAAQAVLAIAVQLLIRTEW